MQVREEFPRKVAMHEDVPILMPDGTRLSARLWLPEDAESDPVPLILEFLPYRKRDGTVTRDMLTHPWFAGHGYACLRVDMRGSGESDGLLTDEYTPQELQDACDVIAWARAQPWCSGQAGMMGISWGGFNSLQVAALRPEGLEAVITLCSTVDRFADDIHTKGGCQLTENFGWASQMLAYQSRPPDPAVVGDRWRQMWLDRLEAQPFLLETWLSHQRRDAYWQHGSVCEDYSAITAAVLSIGGWHDGYRNTIAHLARNLDAPVKGIVGPWNHKYPHFAGPEPRIGFLQEALRWWDRWLKGIETSVESDPKMRLWLMDSVPPEAWHTARPGRWIAEADWPAPDISPMSFHLTHAGLERDPEPLARSIASPADCGANGGEFFPFAYGPELPVDQRDDDARSACFESTAFDAPLDIVGAPRITLRAASDAAQAQVIVRLCDVFPDGTSALITMGCLNLSHRDGAAAPKPMQPGDPAEVAFDLDQIAYRLPAGHRLRVAISTAYWPFLWPSPTPVELTLSSGQLDLPVRPLAIGNECGFEAPEGARPWVAEEIRAAGYERRREVDLRTGEVVTKISTDGGEHRDLAHGLTTSSRTEERWSILPKDPLSARGEIAWVKRMGRDAWQVRMACDTRLKADETHWHWRARLRCWEGETLVFERLWENSAPRDCV